MIGSSGSLLLTEEGELIRQPVCPALEVVDETGAGDNFRAAFCVSLFAEGKSLRESLQVASAAGAVSVSRMGAIPSCCTRKQCQEALVRWRGGGDGSDSWKFASRLNSMKDRIDLWEGEGGVLGWISRQGRVKGLDLVDFNFPQHLTSQAVEQQELDRITSALAAAGLECGAVCLRFPKQRMQMVIIH